MRLRTLHAYMAIFTAPSILFFALTGALQLFDLHEAHGGYQPPALIEKLGRLHKDQVFARDDRHPDNIADKPVSAASDHAPAIATATDDDDPMSATVLKWFFLLVTLVLALTTAFGLWLGLRHNRRKLLGWFLLASGLVLPTIVVML